jgi:amidophosphoribosyltransferase
VNAPYGLGLVHNGNLVNVRELASELERDQKRHLNTNSDSEVLLNILADALQSSPEALSPEVLFQAVSRVCARLEGAYSVMVLINGYGILAFRDPHGIRPLVLGRRRCGEGWDHMVASESVALNVLGYERVGDVAPGEAVLLTKDGRCIRYRCVASTLQTPCLFEYIYLARADSVIDGISVYRARIAMGQELAEKIKRTIPQMDIDVVIPVPDTSRSSALSLSQDLGVKYSEGFMKNRYIGRTIESSTNKTTLSLNSSVIVFNFIRTARSRMA